MTITTTRFTCQLILKRGRRDIPSDRRHHSRVPFRAGLDVVRVNRANKDRNLERFILYAQVIVGIIALIGLTIGE